VHVLLEVQQTMSDEAEVSALWDRAHGRRAQSMTLARIHREVYGDDYFEDAVPNSFYYGTLTDLGRVAHELGVGKGQTVVDLGCGGGAATVWVARETEANLIGIDLSSVGLEQAQRRAHAWDLEGRVRFLLADLRTTGLEAASCDGAMSLDALDTIPRADDRSAAIREAARLLRPGARFVLTMWEWSAPSRMHHPPRDPTDDYRPMLTMAGFELEVYEESSDWRRRDRSVFERIIEAETELQQELGSEAARAMVRLARGTLEEFQHRRRVLAIVRRTSEAT
jgi:ubiquinone/menaquinone biosynthesis C-methylase UbiE